MYEGALTIGWRGQWRAGFGGKPPPAEASKMSAKSDFFLITKKTEQIL